MSKVEDISSKELEIALMDVDEFYRLLDSLRIGPHGEDWWTPIRALLQRETSRGHTDLAQYLATECLFLTCSDSLPDILHELIYQWGADPNGGVDAEQEPSLRPSPLHIACGHREYSRVCAKCVRHLVSAGASLLNLTDDESEYIVKTSFHTLCDQIVEDPQGPEVEEIKSAFEALLSFDHDGITGLKMLRKIASEDSSIEPNRVTPLHYVCSRGNTVLLNALLNSVYARDSSLDFSPFYGEISTETPLDRAFSNRHYDTARILLQNASDLMDIRNEIYTFYKVCLTGDVTAVCLMIDNGLNSLIHTIEPDALPSPHDNDGSGTALFLACLNGHTELVNALLDRGADPNYGGLFSDASFIRECESSEMDRDLYKNEIERDNPIVVASKNGHLSIVELLLRRASTSIRERAINIAYCSTNFVDVKNLLIQVVKEF